MTHLRKTLVLLWTIAALAPITAYSQKASDRSVRCVFFKRPVEISKTAVLVHAGGSTPISLPPMNLSDPAALPAGDLVMAVLPNPPAVGSPIPPGAPTVKIPAAWSRVLLLFFPDPANKVFPVKVLPYDGSIDSFKPGEMFCLNLSNATVGGTLGEVKFKVSPGKTAVLQAPLRQAGAYPVAIDCLLEGETSLRPLCRTVWRNDMKIRKILFIVNADDRPAPRIWSVIEYL